MSSIEEQSAVLIIDMQENGLKRVDDEIRARLIQAQREFLGYCIPHDIPVVAFELYSDTATIPSLTEIIEKVPRHCSLHYSSSNKFNSVALNYLLGNWNIKNIYLAGINASGCVFATVEGAISKGFSIVTAMDLIADDKQFNNDNIFKEYSERGMLYRTYKSIISPIKLF
jgi:nicotinamidase-related amidase